ncbi:hypothetical protein D3C75_825340 [compost metagenome]
MQPNIKFFLENRLLASAFHRQQMIGNRFDVGNTVFRVALDNLFHQMQPRRAVRWENPFLLHRGELFDVPVGLKLCPVTVRRNQQDSMIQMTQTLHQHPGDVIRFNAFNLHCMEREPLNQFFTDDIHRFKDSFEVKVRCITLVFSMALVIGCEFLPPVRAFICCQYNMRVFAFVP